MSNYFCNYKCFVRYFATGLIVVATMFFVAPGSVSATVIFQNTDLQDTLGPVGYVSGSPTHFTYEFPWNSAGSTQNPVYVSVVAKDDYPVTGVQVIIECYFTQYNGFYQQWIYYATTSQRTAMLGGNWVDINGVTSAGSQGYACSSSHGFKMVIGISDSLGGTGAQGYVAGTAGGTLASSVPYVVVATTQQELPVPNFPDTHIISITPDQGDVVSTSTATTTFSTTVYLGDDAVGQVYDIVYDVTGSSAWTRTAGVAGTLDSVNGSQHFSTSTLGIGLGSQTFSWSVPTADLSYKGVRTSSVKVVKPENYLWFFSSGTTLTASSTQWTFGEKSGVELIQEAFASTSQAIMASTTIDLSSCNVISGNFNAGTCLGALFIPRTDDLIAVFEITFDKIKTAFPIGYITDFVSILNSSATSTLPLISATIPNGVAGAGAHIDLALTPNMLDYVWNATTSQFTNSSASSTETLFEIVSYYWDIIVYILLGLYIFTRILGSHVISSPYRKNNSKNI